MRGRRLAAPIEGLSEVETSWIKLIQSINRDSQSVPKLMDQVPQRVGYIYYISEVHIGYFKFNNFGGSRTRFGWV